MSKRWKELEKTTAATLGGRRVTEPWYLFNERPDVVVDLPDGRRLICDAKAYQRFALHRHLDKVATVYCDPGDVPAIVTREPGRTAYVTVPLDFLATLLHSQGE